MNIVKAKDYDDFKCTADNCPYSCCIGWRVDVDKKSFQKYRKIQGKIGQKMNQCISRRRDEGANDLYYGKIKLDDEGRCSFLTKDNLCEMYIDLGEQSMCTTCKTYPRRLNQYGFIYERSLSISCPEVAHSILSQTEPIEFILVEEPLSELDYEYAVKKDINLEEQLILSDVRQLCLTIAQDRSIPIWKRLLLMKKYVTTINQKIKNKTYNEEYLNVLYDGLKDQRVKDILDQLDVDYESKRITLEAINQYIVSIYGVNRGRLKILEKMDNFSQKVALNQIDLQQVEQDFNAFMKDKELFFENYIVYYLFSHYIMDTTIEKDLTTSIILLIIYYALLHDMMQVTWHEQNKQLSQEDMEEIVYTFSRETEHNHLFEEGFKGQEIMRALEDLGCCSILLR